MSKTCAALQFAASATDADILAKCLTVWFERNVNADGSLKPNSYAPIYIVRDDVKLSVRRIGTTLQIFKPGAAVPLPMAKTVWTLPTPAAPVPVSKPRPPSKKRKTRKKAKTTNP